MVDVPIKAVAVWDTVGAFGIPVVGLSPQPAPRAYSFVDSVPAPNVENAFQALALDEHRRHFTPTLWEVRVFGVCSHCPNAPRVLPKLLIKS